MQASTLFQTIFCLLNCRKVRSDCETVSKALRFYVKLNGIMEGMDVSKSMNVNEFDFLYDTSEETKTRFVSFIGDSMKRFDLAITSSNRFYGKMLVTDIQMGKTAIIGPDDLAAEGYLEYVFKLTEEEAVELTSFLEQVVGTVNFTDI